MFTMTSSKICILVFCMVLPLINFAQSKPNEPSNEAGLPAILKGVKTITPELLNWVDYIDRSVNSYSKNDLTYLLNALHSRLDAAPIKCLVSKKSQILNLSFDSISKIITCKNMSTAADKGTLLIKSGMLLFTQILDEVVTAADVMNNCTHQNPFMSFSCIMGEVATLQQQWQNGTESLKGFLITAEDTIKSIQRNVMYCFNASSDAINNKLNSVINVIQECQ